MSWDPRARQVFSSGTVDLRTLAPPCEICEEKEAEEIVAGRDVCFECIGDVEGDDALDNLTTHVEAILEIAERDEARRHAREALQFAHAVNYYRGE